jgi:hypothetical protein
VAGREGVVCWNTQFRSFRVSEFVCLDISEGSTRTRATSRFKCQRKKGLVTFIAVQFPAAEIP